MLRIIKNPNIFPNKDSSAMVLNLFSTTPFLSNFALFHAPLTLNKLKKQMYFL